MKKGEGGGRAPTRQYFQLIKDMGKQKHIEFPSKPTQNQRYQHPTTNTPLDISTWAYLTELLKFKKIIPT